MIKPNTYKILSHLLSYPTIDLKNNINYANSCLAPNEKYIITSLINFIENNDLIYLQEYYVSIFDRKKDFSLYIFEHIHGDSRDRGMAMIDLKTLYKKSNFVIHKTNELPDYIPLFLEYLSLITQKKAKTLISEIINIIAILERRLKIINSSYHSVFTILENISPVKCDTKIINKVISNFNYTKNKNTHLDKEWEEPKIF